MKTISASDANRHFSHLLRDVVAGEEVTVVSRGKPVATISPAQTKRTERESARLDLLERLQRQSASGSRNWTRDELYEG